MKKARAKRYISKHGFDSIASEMLNRIVHHDFRKERRPTPVKSLTAEERCRIVEDADGCCLDAEKLFYGFAPIDPDGMTDEEIRKDLYDAMEVRICSPYDCTGKWFTNYIRLHRNPGGDISYVHSMSLDV